jgi:hypothetical protein
MTDERKPDLEAPPAAGDYEPPAIVALGKLDEMTFGAAGPPFEGATSYV